MKIVFIHLGIEFDGDSLKSKPLGGTETALIGVSRELAKISGNEISIFTNTPTAKEFDGVHYYPAQALAQWALGNEIDVLICVRQWIPFWLPLKTKLRVYFSPDAHDQPFPRRAFDIKADINGKEEIVPLFASKLFFSSVDAFFCVGKWQAQTFVSNLEFPAEKMVVTANGIFPENFSPLPIEKRHKRLMYSATPFRGLEYLVRYFPEIRKSCPDAELEICSGMGVYGVAANEDQKQFGSLYETLKTMGAISHGSIKQSELARIMCADRIYAYPNTFEETFCISVLEAQAAGLVVVTSKKGALVERITDGVDGFLIEGSPHEEKYKREFIAVCVKLLQDDELCRRVSEAAIARAQKQTYSKLAADWQICFESRVASIPHYHEQQCPALSAQEVILPQSNAVKINIDAQTILHFFKQVSAQFGF